MAQNLNPIPPELFLWEEPLPGGCHWSGVMRRGNALRLTDLTGRANVSALFYNAEEKLERYNMPDTLKAQHTAHLTTGHVCYSDMGHVLCSVIADTCGWHDPVCGVSNAEMVKAKYGEANYQTHRNEMHRNGRDGLLIELGKWGLGKRDVVPNVNFFSKVVADEAGRLSFDASNSRPGAYVDLRFEMDVLVVLSAAPHPLDPRPDYAPGDVVPSVNFFSKVVADDAGKLSFDEANSRPGAYVDLRFEMDVLVVLSAAPHPLDPRPDYAPGDVMLTAWKAGTPGTDDVCRNACAENQRGFYQTEILYR